MNMFINHLIHSFYELCIMSDLSILAVQVFNEIRLSCLSLSIIINSKTYQCLLVLVCGPSGPPSRTAMGPESDPSGRARTQGLSPTHPNHRPNPDPFLSRVYLHPAALPPSSSSRTLPSAALPSPSRPLLSPSPRLHSLSSPSPAPTT
jgi:hypothetical protein